MAKWQHEIDLSVVNQEVLKEYQKHEQVIETFLKNHPEKYLSNDNQKYLNELLAKRVSIMKRLGTLKFKN